MSPKKPDSGLRRNDKWGRCGVVFTSLFLAILLLMTSPALAQQLVASYESWRVFTVAQDGNNVCYIASVPTKQEGSFSKRGDPYVIVTHKHRNLEEVSVSSGYPYKEREDAAIVFGQTRFSLFIKGELAWAYDEAADKNIVKAMVRNNEMQVLGTSWKGTKSVDTYSLRGFTQAHRHMKGLCE